MGQNLPMAKKSKVSEKRFSRVELMGSTVKATPRVSGPVLGTLDSRMAGVTTHSEKSVSKLIALE